MTVFEALDILKNYFEEAVKDDKFPVAIQKGDTEVKERAPEIHKMRLPKASDAKKVAPYIIIRYVNSIDKQKEGQPSESGAVFRFIFCVYDSDEEQGALNLINLMDKMRMKLLRETVIGKKLKLNREDGLEMVAYEDDTAPYFAGEIIGTFYLRPIEREVYYEGEIF